MFVFAAVGRSFVLPEEVEMERSTNPLPLSFRSGEGRKLLTACDTCFSISAAGTRVTEPASWLRPFSTAREI
jgi:hypothetical protein